MYAYPIEIIKDSLQKVCGDFTMTKGLIIKTVSFYRDKEYYLVTLDDDSRHIVDQEVVNEYIESAGLKNTEKIAACLLHSIELEESVPEGHAIDRGDDFWDGDVRDALDYLEEKNKGKDDVDYDSNLN